MLGSSRPEDARLRELLASADLTDPEACRRIVKEAAGRLGSIQVFLHAVGRNNRLPILELDDTAWTDLVSLNLSSAYWTGQAVGREMCAAGYGRMIFLSSVSGLLAHANHAPYAATKGGLNQLVRVMAREWAPRGVTVNAVAPGYIETDLTRDYLSQPSIREDLVSLVPAGRLGPRGWHAHTDACFSPGRTRRASAQASANDWSFGSTTAAETAR